MDALKVNEISQVIQSPFGMHLIQVQERRERDVSAERKRVPPVRPCVNASGDAYQDWLRQLRDRTYVENRLEEK
jgi:peptidyl-prolyl cis-trans isomerase SurA